MTTHPLDLAARLHAVRKTAEELAAVAESLSTARLDVPRPLTPDDYRLLYALMADIVDEVLTIGETTPNP